MNEQVDYLTSNALPAISSHAYWRAEERMGLDRQSFGQWVKATWSEWKVVHPSYLRDRNVRCSTSDGSVMCTCPWTPRRGVCMAISPDHCMRTVMVFDEHEVAPSPVQVGRLKDESLLVAVVKKLNDEPSPNSHTLAYVVEQIIGVGILEDAASQETLRLYGDGEISLAAVKFVCRDSIGTRERRLKQVLSGGFTNPGTGAKQKIAG